MEHQISPITTFNDESELYDTKVGVKGKNMPLHYTVHGRTELESRQRAIRLVEIMEKAEKVRTENKFAKTEKHY